MRSMGNRVFHGRDDGDNCEDDNGALLYSFFFDQSFLNGVVIETTIFFSEFNTAHRNFSFLAWAKTV